jgi:hypothetical protein
MRADSPGSKLPEQAVHGIDRILRNVETGPIRAQPVGADCGGGDYYCR